MDHVVIDEIIQPEKRCAECDCLFEVGEEEEYKYGMHEGCRWTAWEAQDYRELLDREAAGERERGDS